MKIAIVGNCGSGKSTLALELHKICNIPLYHLDHYYWYPGWKRPDRHEFEKIHQKLCDEQEWIIEGVATSLFEYRIEKADIIIFLDFPLHRCLFRVYKRALWNYGKVYFSSAYGCPERLPDFEFLKFICNFNRTRKPKIKELLKRYGATKKIFIVCTISQISVILCYIKENIGHNITNNDI